MTTAVGEQEIRVVISKGHMAAELHIPSGFPRDMLSEQMVMGLLQQSGVEINDAVIGEIRTMIANPPPPGEEQHTILAQATPPQRGNDGYIQWDVSEPDERPPDDASEDKTLSHYDRSAYLIVKLGDVVGRVFEPTSGVDGRDVLGQTIAAKPGKPANLKTDETILRDDTGRLVVQVEGVLRRGDDSASVQQKIEVPGYVDFSTGNIDFTGHVVIQQGVRDCFVVKATGNVEVKGLIEAATIQCGGDLLALGGMAGRERGHVEVGGHLVGKYLDNIQGDVKGDLEIQRELINCELSIHGGIRSPRGTIIGGRMTVTGQIELLALGSGAGVATELILGSVPKLEPIAMELDQLVEKLTAKRAAIEAEQKLMKNNVRMMTASDKERQTEITFEYQLVTTKLGDGMTAQEALKSRIKQIREVSLLVHRKLCQGVVLTVGNQSFKILNDTRGPIHVFLDARGEVVYRVGQSDGGLLTKIAELKAAAV